MYKRRLATTEDTVTASAANMLRSWSVKVCGCAQCTVSKPCQRPLLYKGTVIRLLWSAARRLVRSVLSICLLLGRSLMNRSPSADLNIEWAEGIPVSSTFESKAGLSYQCDPLRQ